MLLHYFVEPYQVIHLGRIFHSEGYIIIVKYGVTHIVSFHDLENRLVVQNRSVFECMQNFECNYQESTVIPINSII